MIITMILLAVSQFTGQLAYNQPFNIVAWGDSNTLSGGVGWVMWMPSAMELEDVSDYAAGFAGYGCLDILAQFDSAVLPNYDTGAFCVILAGLNDDNGINTADSIYKWITMLCDTAITHGFTTLVCTYPMQQHIMYQVNDLIQTNWATFADGIVDCSADPLIGESADHDNTDWFGNVYHWSNGGRQRFSELYVAPAVRSLL